jgi:hypothetical protein
MKFTLATSLRSQHGEIEGCRAEAWLAKRRRSRSLQLRLGKPAKNNA